MSRPFAAAVLLFAAVLASATSAAPPATTVRPTLVRFPAKPGTVAEVVADLAKQAGIPVDASAIDGAKPVAVPTGGGPVPFWAALETVAKAAGGRVAVRGGGKKVVLEPGPAPPTAIDGPYRVVVRQVRAITDFDTGKAYTELNLDIHWEPRFPVFRISSQPTITAVTDDRGSKLVAETGGSKIPATGYLHSATVRIAGVPRAATKLTRVAGEFTVTAAEKMQAVTFDDLTSTATVEQSQAGVTVRVKPLRKVEDAWEAEIDLKYPADHPVFESFEAYVWATRNRARLIAPGGAAAFDADPDPDFPDRPGRVTAVYRFTETKAKKPDLGTRREWKLVYETPTPLLEYPVRFVLTDVPLP